MGSGMHGLPKPEGGGGGGVVAIAATVVTYQFCPGQNSPPPTVADFNQCTPFLKLYKVGSISYYLYLIIGSVLSVW